MRFTLFVLLFHFSNAVFSQVPSGDFETEDWLIIEPDQIELGLLKIQPEKKVVAGDFTVFSNEKIVVKQELETDKIYEFSVIAYDEFGNLIELQTELLDVEFKGNKVPFTVQDLSKSKKETLFTFILDDSGSMQGSPIDELTSVLESFMLELTNDSFKCRFIWFSTTHESMQNDWSSCNSQEYKSITVRGEYGGTEVYSGFMEAVSDFKSLGYDNSDLKNIIIISDGADGSTTEQYSEMREEIDQSNISTYLYLIGENPNHSMKPIVDFSIDKNADISDYLPLYLAGIQEQLSRKNFIEILKEDLE